MEIPDRIKIGGHVYKILCPHIFKERGDCVGQYDSLANEIRLSSEDSGGQPIAESSILVTLIHEILHVIDVTTGHHVFVDNEKAIEGFSNAIFQVLIDNGYLKESPFSTV